MNDTQPNEPGRIDPRLLVSCYLEDKLTPEQFDELTRWLHADGENARAFMCQCVLVDHIREAMRWDDVAGTPIEEVVDDGRDTLALLQGLLEDEQKQPAVMVSFGHDPAHTAGGQAPRSLSDPPDAGSRSTSDFKAVAGYLLRHTLTPRRIAYAAAAAVLLMATTLVVVLQPGQNEPTRIATPPIEVIPPAQAVATLTATHDAQWAGTASAAPAQGDTLRAGQTLTLTHGIAEITTGRGAIVTLEAPATIELFDNDNAMRLIQGKMVGRVESARAHGFYVRTPHMGVTDLGTRFGIDATDRSVTEVHVFEGSVEASHTAPGSNASTRVLLETGSAVKAQAGGDQLINIEPDAIRFASVRIDDATTSPDAASAGIARMTGGVRWSPMQPKLLESRFDLAEGEDAFIYAELRGHRLGKDIPLTIHATGTTRQFKDLQPKDVPAGTVIRSYLVCLNGGRDSGQNALKSIASVRFDGEILGVIATIPHWEAFEQRLAGETDGFFRFTRVGLGPLLEGTDSALSRDEVFISEDRHTLAFRLEGTSFAEFIRVVVKEPAEEKSP